MVLLKWYWEVRGCCWRYWMHIKSNKDTNKYCRIICQTVVPNFQVQVMSIYQGKRGLWSVRNLNVFSPTEDFSQAHSEVNHSFPILSIFQLCARTFFLELTACVWFVFFSLSLEKCCPVSNIVCVCTNNNGFTWIIECQNTTERVSLSISP